MIIYFLRGAEARKSSEWSSWYRNMNASVSDGQGRYFEERYRCTCQAEVSHASQLRQPVVRKARRICSQLHGCTAGIYIVFITIVVYNEAARSPKIWGKTAFPKFRMRRTRNVRRILVRGSVPACRLRRRKFWKFDYEMVHSEVYLNKYVVSIAPFSTPACPDCSQNIT